MTGAATVAIAASEVAILALAVPGAVEFATDVFESVLTCVDDAACPVSACELAAMAAAAIVSGAVVLPDAGVAAGTFVVGVVTGTATATGFGVVTGRTTCWAGPVGSAVDVSPLACSSVDFADPVFEVLDFAPDGWVTPPLAEPLALALASALAGGAAFALLFGSFAG